VEKLHTELEYLKAQINPHFLFNSINTIYFQIDRTNSTARDTLAAFSEMLRYQLYECNGHAVQVEKEIAYLKHYVDLQRVRRDANYTITFAHENTNGFSVAPLLFIPFIENAFKHVSHFSSGNEVHISMRKEEDRFRITIVNTRDPGQPGSGSSHGIGLRNARRRLELLYNGRHTLTIQERPQHFEVNLELTINDHEDQLPHRG
jgi:LytS/YehU family sensor histidine kinase